MLPVSAVSIVPVLRTIPKVLPKLPQAADQVMVKSGEVLGNTIKDIFGGNISSVAAIIAACAIGSIILMTTTQHKNGDVVVKVEANYGKEKAGVATTVTVT